jgi:hypothetical protein
MPAIPELRGIADGADNCRGGNGTDGAPEVAEGFFVKLGPDLLAGLPDHAPETAPRVPQGHHEQPRAPVSAGLRIAGQCAFAMVDLCFLA